MLRSIGQRNETPHVALFPLASRSSSSWVVQLNIFTAFLFLLLFCLLEIIIFRTVVQYAVPAFLVRSRFGAATTAVAPNSQYVYKLNDDDSHKILLF